MHRLTKSMLRVPWALSMFGIGQVGRLVDGREGRRRLMSSLDTVSAAVEQQMSERGRTFYQAADRLQSGMVDAAFAGFAGKWSDPRPAVGRAWRMIGRPWSADRKRSGEESE